MLRACCIPESAVPYTLSMESHAESIPRPARRKPEARSRVGNGKVLLPMTDGRSLTARRFQDLYEDLGSDLGGLDLLSEAQKQMIRRAATLSAESERQEAEWANGRPFDLAAYSTTANCLRRIFETLGMERRSRDVTPTLQNYLQAKGQP
jgi:hypothetical protein